MAHIMELPSVVIVGRRLVSRIVETVVAASNGRPVLLVTSRSAYGLYSRSVSESLAANVELDEHFVEGSVAEELQRIGETLGKKPYGVIVGVGGGRVVDIAKVSAYEAGVRLVSVPTVASHDGIASPMASIKGGGTLYSKKTRTPFAVIADIDIIEKAPFRYTASGCGDLIAKYTAVRDWKLGHRVTGEYYGEYAANLAYMSAEIIFRNAAKIGRREPDWVRTVVEALISAGVAMGIAGSSRPCSGSEHLISHALEALIDNPPLHGELCGVATVFTAMLHNAAWRRVKRALTLIGAPSSLPELGIDEQTFVKAVLMAPNVRPDRYTILHKLRLDAADIRQILKKAELV